jgi:hypothetical protein
MVLILLAVALAVPNVIMLTNAQEKSASLMMLDHSRDVLNRTASEEVAMQALASQLEMKSMQTDVFFIEINSTRDAAKNLIQVTCAEKDVPEKVCGVVAASLDTVETKWHTKKSIPLDGYKGSLYFVWLWVKPGSRDDEIQVAVKGASTTYQLRDVITYREQIDDEPVVKCTQKRTDWLFSSSVVNECHEVSRRKTVTQLPVFEKTTMTHDQLELPEQMMENKLAKEVLAKVNHAKLGNGATHPKLEAKS